MAINCRDPTWRLEPDSIVKDLATRHVYIVRMQDDKAIQKVP